MAGLPSIARRRFIQAVAVLVSIPQALWAREYQGGFPWTPKASNPPEPFNPDIGFLTLDEKAFVKAAVDRLIPEDDFPGASALGVVDFIDHQLEGSFGRGDMYYLQGPFAEGLETQGYQSIEPAQLYRQAITQLQSHITRRFDGKPFQELSEEQQDALLHELEDGSLSLPDIDGVAFFETLLQNTNEGYFGDPLYGGNRDMQAWKMIGFPGARYDYRPYVKQHNVELQLIPVSIAVLDPTTGTGDSASANQDKAVN